MTFSHINSFDTDDPKRLSRQLSDLEDNISEELASIEANAGSVRPTAFMPVGANSIVALQPNEQRSFDTSLSSAIAVLPSLNPVNYGKRFALIKRKAANSVTVRCADATVLCNGVAFPVVITAIGARVFYCDQTGYYS